MTEDLEFRINKLVDDLTDRRARILEDYLAVLEEYNGGRAADHAGMLHDIDKHITNCLLEIRRLQGLKAKVADASR